MSPSRFSRRALLAAILPSALAAPALLSPALARSNNSRPNARAMPRLSFPDGFRWGTATSSYQVEGAPAERSCVQSLSGIVDAVVNAIAQGDDGERLTQHALRLEARIRAAVAGGDPRDQLCCVRH